eukprot:tig00001307_g8122.t1
MASFWAQRFAREAELLVKSEAEVVPYLKNFWTTGWDFGVARKEFADLRQYFGSGQVLDLTVEQTVRNIGKPAFYLLAGFTLGEVLARRNLFGYVSDEDGHKKH